MIQEIFEHTEEQLLEKDYAVILPKIPTEIEYLKHITDYIALYGSKYPKSLILLIYNLSISPFIQNFVGRGNFVEQIIMFVKGALNKEKKLDKYIYKILAHLIKNHKITKEIVDVKSLPDFLELGGNTKTVNLNKALIITYYRLLRELSRIIKYDFMMDIRIETNDTVILKRLKAKILSFQNVTPDVLNHLAMFLNDKDTKFGWTLGKAIVRVIMDHGSTNILETLISNLKCLFAHESLYINTSQILGFLILKGFITNKSDVNDKNIIFIEDNVITSMIYYNNKTDSKNEQVRETGLFLMWSLIRMDNCINKKKMLHNLIAVSLFDFSLSCRRAACTVLLELVQRTHVKNHEKITDIINFHMIRRFKDCMKNVDEIIELVPSIKETLVKIATDKVTDYENGLFIATFLRGHYKCFCTVSIPLEKDINVYFGLSYLFNEFKEQRFCDKCITSENINVLKKLKFKVLYDEKLFNEFVNVFFITMNYFVKLDFDIIENLTFLLDKNIKPYEIARLARQINNQEFKKILFTNLIRKNNDSYILSNSYNIEYRDKINEKYLKTLTEIDALKKASVITSLKVSFGQKNGLLNNYKPSNNNINQFYEIVTKYARNSQSYEGFIEGLNTEEALIFHIILGLEDYSVYIKGDSGYFVRKASFEFLTELKCSKVINLYFIRYFVEKSPSLRHDICSVIKNDILDSNVMDFYIQYKQSYEILCQENEHIDEEVHFRSCFEAFNILNDCYKEQFILGILSTFRNCDGYVLRFMSEILFERFAEFSPFILNFLGLRKRFRFLAVYFLRSYLEKTSDVSEIERIGDMVEFNIKDAGTGLFSVFISQIAEIRNKLNE